MVKGKSYGQDHGVIVLMPNILNPKRDRVAMIIAGATAYTTSVAAYFLANERIAQELDKLDNCNTVVVKAVRDEHRQGFYSDAEIVDKYLL